MFPDFAFYHHDSVTVSKTCEFRYTVTSGKVTLFELTGLLKISWDNENDVGDSFAPKGLRKQHRKKIEKSRYDPTSECAATDSSG